MKKILIAASFMLSFCANAHSSSNFSVNTNTNKSYHSYFEGMSLAQISKYRHATSFAYSYFDAIITICDKGIRQLNHDLVASPSIGFLLQVYFPRCFEIHNQERIIISSYQQYVDYDDTLQIRKQSGSITIDQLIEQITEKTLDFIMEMNQIKISVLAICPNVNKEALDEFSVDNFVFQNYGNQ